MKISTKILYITSSLFGILGVMTGMMNDSVSGVIGGGMFMAYSIAIFVLNK